MASADEKFVFNGIDGSNGSYLTRPMTIDELAALARGSWVTPEEEARRSLAKHKEYLDESRDLGIFDVMGGVDAGKLSETGWGVIFPHDGDPAVMDALKPLIEHRRKSAGDQLCRTFAGPDGYRPKDTNVTFLTRHNAKAFGKVDPDRMPYYLLIVGSPEQIPFGFQHSLDVNHAVGRLYFDRVEDYAHYAASVIRAETEGASRSARASFFGVRNPDDRATQMSSEMLVTPLFDKIRTRSNITDHWKVESFLAAEATKARMLDAIVRGDGPAFLFTASHGLGFSNGDPMQEKHQGALLCQEWPGPLDWRGRGAIPRDQFLSAEDIADDADVHGMIAFHFACYGAGTPDFEDYDVRENKPRGRIAPRPFVGSLPKRLLSHPRGSALACIGHIERAWSFSFSSRKVQSTVEFWDAAFNLLTRSPVGHAMDAFHVKFAEVSAGITDKLDADRGKPADQRLKPEEFVLDWVERNDARNYVLLGDPAVRLVPEKLGKTSPPAPRTPEIVSPSPTGAVDTNPANGKTPKGDAADASAKPKPDAKAKSPAKGKGKGPESGGGASDFAPRPVPGAYRDITNYLYLDAQGRRELTITPAVGKVDEALAFQAAWSHLATAAELLGATEIRMGPPARHADGRLTLTASFAIGEGEERRRQHFGVVRLADGRCLQVQLTSDPADEQAAELLEQALARFVEPAAGTTDEGVDFAAASPAGSRETIGEVAVRIPDAFAFASTRRYLSADGSRSFDLEFRDEAPAVEGEEAESFGAQPDVGVRGQFGTIRSVRRLFRDPIRYEAPEFEAVGAEPGAVAFETPGGGGALIDAYAPLVREKSVTVGGRPAIVRYSGTANGTETADAEIEAFLETLR